MLEVFDKLDDIVFEPVKAICDWIREPLKGREDKRQNKKMQLEAQIEMGKREQEVELEIRKRKQFERLAKETEEWEAKIDDFRKRQEIARNKEILEAIVDYRKSMIEDAKEIAYQLSVMKIELLDKVNDVAEKKLNKYMEQQRKAEEECDAELIKIGDMFANNERIRFAREDMVMSKLKNILTTAEDFMSILKEDVKDINVRNGIFIDNAGMLADKILMGMGTSLMGKTIDVIEKPVERNMIEEKN